MPTLFASSEKNVQWIKVVTNDSIATCSSALYIFPFWNFRHRLVRLYWYISYLRTFIIVYGDIWLILITKDIHIEVSSILFERFIMSSSMHISINTRTCRHVSKCTVMHHDASFSSFQAVFQRGLEQRAVAAHAMNAESSRSHVLFTVGRLSGLSMTEILFEFHPYFPSN